MGISWKHSQRALGVDNTPIQPILPSKRPNIDTQSALVLPHGNSKEGLKQTNGLTEQSWRLQL